MAKVLKMRGAVSITRTDLKKIEPPAETETWQPIKHYNLLAAIEDSLKRVQISIHEEDLAVQQNGAILFGVLDLRKKGPNKATEGYTSALGIRSSNNKRIAIQLAVGARVTVCDNLCFSGDFIALRRKHTNGLALEFEIDEAVERFSNKFESFTKEIRALREREIKDSEAKAIMFDTFVNSKIMPIRLLQDVAKEYFSPSFDEFKARTAWSLQNAFTFAAKDMPENRRFLALRALGKFFGEMVSR